MESTGKEKVCLSDLKIERDFGSDIFDLFDELLEHVKSIKWYCDVCADSDDTRNLEADLREVLNKAGLDPSKLDVVPYYENPFVNRNWDLHNIGRPNIFSHTSLTISQLRLKVIEEILSYNPKNDKLKSHAEQLRQKFETEYSSSYYVD